MQPWVKIFFFFFQINLSKSYLLWLKVFHFLEKITLIEMFFQRFQLLMERHIFKTIFVFLWMNVLFRNVYCNSTLYSKQDKKYLLWSESSDDFLIITLLIIIICILIFAVLRLTNFKIVIRRRRRLQIQS